MNILDMKFEEKTFDVIIDKATIDTLQAGVKDPWNVPPEVKSTVDTCLRECSRVLKPAGMFIMVSFQ